MSREQPEVSTSFLWILAAGLTVYCIVLTAITGDIGFDGDDWWVLACPYWHNFWDAVGLYVYKFQRPFEGLYLISLFELVGFNKMAFHLCSLLLLAGSAVLMGASLNRAYPGRQDYVSMAVLLAFFLPPVSCLTYVMFTDNSRICMLFFWACAIAFQRWAEKPSSWFGLLPPMLLYLCSFLTYEAASFLVFAVPLLVWPVHRRYADGTSDRAFLLKLGSAIMIAFVGAVVARFVILRGGAVNACYLVPPFEMIWSYLALLPVYVLSPFTSMSADRWALLAGLLVVLECAGLFFLSRRDRPTEEMQVQGQLEPASKWQIVALGVAILMLGMLPYQLAGYGGFVETVMVKYGLLKGGDVSWFNFTWASRIFSSASFGFAILLACALSGYRRSWARVVGKIAAVAIIGFMAVFHAGLSEDWREAAQIRNNLVQSLVKQVPAVESGTNLVFLNIECSHKRAAVIRRENGVKELVQMVYGDRNLGAWRLYPYAYDPMTQVYQQAVVTPEGFLCRSQRQSATAPQESLLLFKRSGNELVLLDKIAKDDGLVPSGIDWKGVDRLTSNFQRIQAGRTMATQARFDRNPWTSSLFSTLRLGFLKPAQAPVARQNVQRCQDPDRQ